MKEFKGTKGNWIAEKDFSKEYEQHVFKINDVNETIEGLAEVYSGTDDDTCREFKECEANANLIAAAPELLEALQLYVSSGAGPNEAMQKAKEAINKAL